MSKSQQPEKDPLKNNLGKTGSKRPLGPVVLKTSGGPPAKAGGHSHHCEICSGTFKTNRDWHDHLISKGHWSALLHAKRAIALYKEYTLAALSLVGPPNEHAGTQPAPPDLLSTMASLNLMDLDEEKEWVNKARETRMDLDAIVEKDKWRDFLTATTRGTLGRFMSQEDRDFYEDEDPDAADFFLSCAGGASYDSDAQSDAYDSYDLGLDDDAFY